MFLPWGFWVLLDVRNGLYQRIRRKTSAPNEQAKGNYILRSVTGVEKPAWGCKYSPSPTSFTIILSYQGSLQMNDCRYSCKLSHFFHPFDVMTCQNADTFPCKRSASVASSIVRYCDPRLVQYTWLTLSGICQRFLKFLGRHHKGWSLPTWPKTDSAG